MGNKVTKLASKSIEDAGKNILKKNENKGLFKDLKHLKLDFEDGKKILKELRPEFDRTIDHLQDITKKGYRTLQKANDDIDQIRGFYRRTMKTYCFFSEVVKRVWVKMPACCCLMFVWIIATCTADSVFLWANLLERHDFSLLIFWLLLSFCLLLTLGLPFCVLLRTFRNVSDICARYKLEVKDYSFWRDHNNPLPLLKFSIDEIKASYIEVGVWMMYSKRLDNIIIHIVSINMDERKRDLEEFMKELNFWKKKMLEMFKKLTHSDLKKYPELLETLERETRFGNLVQMDVELNKVTNALHKVLRLEFPRDTYRSNVFWVQYSIGIVLCKMDKFLQFFAEKGISIYDVNFNRIIDQFKRHSLGREVEFWIHYHVPDKDRLLHFLFQECVLNGHVDSPKVVARKLRRCSADDFYRRFGYSKEDMNEFYENMGKGDYSISEFLRVEEKKEEEEKTTEEGHSKADSAVNMKKGKKEEEEEEEEEGEEENQRLRKRK